MKKLVEYINEADSSSINSDSVDFEDYLDEINETIEEVQQHIEEFNNVAGNIADNDLSNQQRAIKEYITAITEKLDELDTVKGELNKQHSVNVL